MFLALFYLKNLNFLYNNVKFRWVCPRWDYILLEGGGGNLCCASRCPPFCVSKCMRVKTEAIIIIIIMIYLSSDEVHGK